MSGILSAFAWSITPAYFLVGHFFKTQWTESQKARKDKKIGFLWAGAIIFFVTMLAIYMLWILTGIFVEIKDLISGSFRRLSEGDIQYSFESFEKVIVASFNVNAGLEVLSCCHPQLRRVFKKFLKLLKWAAQHIMNLIAVMSFYYACYDKNAEKGNLLLLALTCEIFIVWLVRDIFEIISNRLHVNGYVLEVIYQTGADGGE